MPGIQQLIDNVSAISFNQVIEEAIEQTAPELIKQQQAQMLTAQNSDGGVIGYYASPAYKARKLAANPLAGGKVDLKLTGDFQRSIFVDPRLGSVVIDSGDSKAGMLIEKYGENIFGLNDKSMANYNPEHLAPAANKIIAQKINK